jgi:hypothetical protein
MFRSDRLHLKAGGLILYASERLKATLHQGLMNIVFRESLWYNVIMNLDGITCRSIKSNERSTHDIRLRSPDSPQITCKL